MIVPLAVKTSNRQGSLYKVEEFLGFCCASKTVQIHVEDIA